MKAIKHRCREVKAISSKCHMQEETVTVAYNIHCAHWSCMLWYVAMYHQFAGACQQAVLVLLQCVFSTGCSHCCVHCHIWRVKARSACLTGLVCGADPFQSDETYIVSVLTLEELGATGNKGLSSVMTNPVNQDILGGLAASATAFAAAEVGGVGSQLHSSGWVLTEHRRIAVKSDSCRPPEGRAAAAKPILVFFMYYVDTHPLCGCSCAAGVGASSSCQGSMFVYVGVVRLV